MGMPNRVCKALILHTSSTPWKFHEMAVPFAASFDENGILLEPSSRYFLTHSPIEDNKTAIGNLVNKAAAAKADSRLIRENRVTQQKFIEQLNRESIYFKGGNDTAMHRTYAMADDTVHLIPEDIWCIVEPQLKASYIVDDSIITDPELEEIDGVMCRRITSIGPIMNGVTQKIYWGLLREAAATIDRYRDNKPVIIHHEVNCSLTRFSYPDTEPYINLKTSIPLRLYAPNGLKGEVPTQSLIDTPDDYLCLPDAPLRPVVSNYSFYVLELSARKKMHDVICRIIEQNEKDIPHNNVVSLFPAVHEITGVVNDNKSKDIKIALLSAGVAEGNALNFFGDIPAHRQVFIDQGSIQPDAPPDVSEEDRPVFTPDFEHALSMRFRFGKDTNYTPPDIVVFEPFDATDETARLYNYAMLDAAIVEKTTNPSSQDMQIIVLNNGCFDDYYAKHVGYANNGYSKEYVRPNIHMGLADDESVLKNSAAQHIPLFDVDWVNHKDNNQLHIAAHNLVQFHLRDYHRLEPQTFGDYEGGVKSPDGRYATAFGSACSDKLADNANGDFLGKLCAKLGIGFRTGAIDQHVLWKAALAHLLEAGSLKRKNTFVSGISTHMLIKVETRKAAIAAEFTHHKTFDLLGRRLGELCKGMFMASVGGGDGTSGETTLFHFLKLVGHPIARDKDIFYIGAEPSMHAELITQIGHEKFNALLNNPWALEEKGIYLFPTAEAAEDTIIESVRKFGTRPAIEKSLAPRAAHL